MTHAATECPAELVAVFPFLLLGRGQSAILAQAVFISIFAVAPCMNTITLTCSLRICFSHFCSSSMNGAAKRDELDEEDRQTVARARKVERFLSQPFDVAQVFTGFPGIQVPVEDTVRSFKGLIEGEYDHLPEAAFYMVGSIEQAVEKAEKMSA